MSFGRIEEALREYLICLSIEPDCRLAKTEAHKVYRALLVFTLSSILCLCVIAHSCKNTEYYLHRPQLLSEILAPVTDQVPGHVSDCSSILSSREHVQSSITSPVQVQERSDR